MIVFLQIGTVIVAVASILASVGLLVEMVIQVAIRRQAAAKTKRER